MVKILSVLMTFSFIATALVSAAPVHIHITTESDPRESVTITWQTPTGVAEGSVEYGLDNEYGSSVDAVSHTYTGASGLIWDAVLTGLIADTAYHYHCGSDADGWSPDHTFHTAPAPGSPIDFISLGDNRTNLNIWATITARVLQYESPRLVLHNGDMVASGNSQADWDGFFDNAAGLLAETILIPVEGNHDVGNLMYPQFAFPTNGGNGEKYFSFNWGDAHILCLNTETGSTDINGAQANFLQNDLTANAESPWKIALYHRGFYTCGEHEGEMDPYKPAWLTPMENLGIDACFNGHDHFYQRTVPIRDDQQQPEYGNAAGQGICHLVTGGAGAPLYTVGSCWWIAYGQSVYHYAHVTIDGDTITSVAKDINGNIIDTVSWTKTAVSPTPTPIFSYTPTPLFTGTPQPTNTPAGSHTPSDTPTPTPTPYYQLGVTLTMPATHFVPGDEFYLRLTFNNSGPTLYNVPVVTVLAIGDSYWFAPSWQLYDPDSGSGFDFSRQAIPSGTIQQSAINPFNWPTGAGSLDGIQFIAGLLTQDMASILGDYDVITWSFSE